MQVYWMEETTVNTYAVIGFNKQHDKNCWAIYVHGEDDEYIDDDRYVQIILDFEKRFSKKMICTKYTGLDAHKPDETAYNYYFIIQGGGALMFFENEADAREIMTIFNDETFYASEFYAALYDNNGFCVDENT